VALRPGQVPTSGGPGGQRSAGSLPSAPRRQDRAAV